MVQPQHSHRPPLHPVLEAYVNVTGAAYTAKGGDRVIGVNRAGTATITLPTAEVRKGRTYTIKDESGAAATNNITVDTEGSETIDGAATDVISDNYGCVTYYSDGSNWFTVPLLAVGSHTLASHSSEAHSELSGVGTDDHHAQSHTLDSHNAGTLQHEKGGLEADVNAGDGFVEIKAGATTVIKSNTAATAAPGTTDDSAAGYAVGSVWIDTTNDKAYVCLDATATAAVWTEITQAGGGPAEALQSDMEDEGATNADRYVSPETAKYAPSAAKAWIHFDGTGTPSIDTSFNVASLTDSGTGDYRVNFTTAFSGDDYAWVVNSTQQANSSQQQIPIAAYGTVTTRDGSHVLTDDNNIMAVGFGDQ